MLNTPFDKIPEGPHWALLTHKSVTRNVAAEGHGYPAYSYSEDQTEYFAFENEADLIKGIENLKFMHPFGIKFRVLHIDKCPKLKTIMVLD